MIRSRLEVLKALGDDTRYAIYVELARSPRPLATADLAERLGLHANTVRPHLERMREVGLLELSTEVRTGVGRPQHLYAPAPDAPSLGLEPAPYPLLAAMLARMARLAGVGPAEALDAGREQGRADARGHAGAPSALEGLVAELDDVGFDPEVAGTDDGEVAVISFTHCPFRDLAEAHPELVCALHRGMVEGFVEGMGGGQVVAFHDLVHREPCQVAVLSG